MWKTKSYAAMIKSITLLCAEAMFGSCASFPDSKCVYVNGFTVYNPLNDDAQAMALVKKFDINTWKEDGKWCAMWAEQYENGASAAGAESDDLNRAICETVAKMQAAKASA